MSNNIKTILVSIVIAISNDKIWLQSRGDKLEFPGGKIEPNEIPKQAAVRELNEEVGIKLDESQIDFFKRYNFEYPEVRVEIFSFLFHDNNKLFEASGYRFINEMLGEYSGQNYGQNLNIIKDLQTYFQPLRA